MEIARLRAELAHVKMERDILGKATAYFAKLRREVAYIIVSPAHNRGVISDMKSQPIACAGL
jgi:transposase-like protein